MGIFDALKKHDKQGFLKIDVKPLIDWDKPNGEGCLASDMITKKGWKVGYMYREEPSETMPDSGWHSLYNVTTGYRKPDRKIQ